MAERRKQTELKYLDDPKKLERRIKNREAVKKHRKNEEKKERERKKKKENLRLKNARLEGEVSQMKLTREILKNILIEQLRKKGQQLTTQQMEFLRDDFEDEIEDMKENEVGIVTQQMTHLKC